jgi:hypothetical protein
MRRRTFLSVAGAGALAVQAQPAVRKGRLRQGVARWCYPKWSVEELAERAAGLAVAAYLVQAGLDAAEHRAVPVSVFQQEMLRELVRVRGMIRQAVARLDASGEPGLDLEPAVAYCMRAIRHADEAALLLSRRLR